MPAGRKELRERIDELGTATAHNNYPWGWTMAGNTPFRRWKREVHEGGIADPCILHWPNGIAGRGEVRHQFVHAIDVAPTIFDLIGAEPPAEIAGVEQSPVDGISFASVLREATAPATRTTQYFEMLGSRGIYHDGWKAVTFKPLGAMYDDGLDPDAPFEDDVWELYHVAEDLTEYRRPRGGAPRQARRDGRPLVGGGAQVRRAPPRQPPDRGAARAAARVGRPTRTTSSTPAERRSPRTSR